MSRTRKKESLLLMLFVSVFFVVGGHASPPILTREALEGTSTLYENLKAFEQQYNQQALGFFDTCFPESRPLPIEEALDEEEKTPSLPLFLSQVWKGHHLQVPLEKRGNYLLGEVPWELLEEWRQRKELDETSHLTVRIPLGQMLMGVKGGSSLTLSDIEGKVVKGLPLYREASLSWERGEIELIEEEKPLARLLLWKNTPYGEEGKELRLQISGLDQQIGPFGGNGETYYGVISFTRKHRGEETHTVLVLRFVDGKREG